MIFGGGFSREVESGAGDQVSTELSFISVNPGSLLVGGLGAAFQGPNQVNLCTGIFFILRGLKFANNILGQNWRKWACVGNCDSYFSPYLP